MKNDLLKLCFTGNDGSILLNCKLTSTPLHEEEVLRLSVEFFNDPEPCMIHRSAVMSRIYMELLEYLFAQVESGMASCEFNKLPDRLARFIDIKGCNIITISTVVAKEALNKA